MSKLIIEDTLKIAQIRVEHLNPEILAKLEEHASFRDTDSSLDECIVNTGALDSIAEEWEGMPNKEHLVKEVEEMKEQLEFYNYIHILKV